MKINSYKQMQFEEKIFSKLKEAEKEADVPSAYIISFEKVLKDLENLIQDSVACKD